MPVFFPPASSAIPAGVQRLEDDFTYPSGALFQNWKVAQSGGSVTPANSTAANYGVLTLSAGGAAGFVSVNRAVAVILIPAGFWQFNCNCVLPVLSAAGDRFTVRMGLGDVDSGDFNNGVYFEYTDNAANGHWQACLANGGVRTKLDTGVALVAGGLFSLRAGGIGNAGPVTFNINGASVGGFATNFPAANPVGFVMGIYNAAATVAHLMTLDYWGWYYGVTR